MIKSKRFWLNAVTAVTMIGSIANVLELSEGQMKIVTFVVAVANIVLQTWFNADTRKRDVGGKFVKR